MSENKKGFTFTWKIENFSMLPHQKGEELSSKTFEVDMFKETGWYLRLYPRGDNQPESEGHVSLFFKKTKEDTLLKINYKLVLESTDSSSEVIIGCANLPTQVGWGDPKFISLIDLYEKKKLFLPNDTLTLRLELRQANEDENSTGYFIAESCVSRTSILIHRRSMLWHINNINNHREQDHRILSSYVKDSPSLKLSCNLLNISKNDYIPISIRQICLSPNKNKLFVKCKITVISAHKEFQDSAESTHLFSLELSDVFHFPPFLKSSNLTNDKYFYLDDALLLQCEFAFSYKTDICHSELNHMPLSFDTKKLCVKTQFTKSIEDLYMHGKFCDIHLQAGGEMFPAYKMLLCTRSSVFTAMLEHDMKEKNSNVVEITDIEPTTLKRMLEFIHVDAVKEELSPKDACELYEAADKYNIESLKRMCSLLLTSAMSVTNVVDVLALADAHNDNFMMNAAHTFISINSNETFHSTQWESFMDENPKLSMKIMHQWIKEQRF